MSRKVERLVRNQKERLEMKNTVAEIRRVLLGSSAGSTRPSELEKCEQELLKLQGRERRVGVGTEHARSVAQKLQHVCHGNIRERSGRNLCRDKN